MELFDDPGEHEPEDGSLAFALIAARVKPRK
jgi:hypothetical protein